MNKIFENACGQNMPFDLPWSREDKVFTATLAITVITVFSLIIKYSPGENIGPLAEVYLAMSIAIGSFTAIIVMEIDKKIREDKYLKAEILYTAVTMGTVMAVAAAGFAAGFIVIMIRPFLMFPTILVVTYVIMFHFVPKMDGISAFIVRKVTGRDATY